MLKLNVGDKIIAVNDFKKEMCYSKWDIFEITKIYKSDLRKYQAKKISNSTKNMYDNENYFSQEFIDTYFQKFIEPKFKVGDKFYLKTDSGIIQIELVKTSLNKKFGEYANLLFNISNGQIIALMDSNLSKLVKVEKPKTMTIDEIEQFLGYKIIIKK